MSHDLSYIATSSTSLENVVLTDSNKTLISNLIREQKYHIQLHNLGIPLNNKVLLYGPSGVGKTMTAHAIACELDRKLISANLSNIVSSRIGETAKNIKMLFDKAQREKAILFLDEFDHLATTRSSGSAEVGEMRRLVNSILQLLDMLSNETLLIAATNYISLLDTAIIRRFQLRIEYLLPSDKELDLLYDKLLINFQEQKELTSRKYGISYAEARDHFYTEIKELLITRWERNGIEQPK